MHLPDNLVYFANVSTRHADPENGHAMGLRRMNCLRRTYFSAHCEAHMHVAQISKRVVTQTMPGGRYPLRAVCPKPHALSAEKIGRGYLLTREPHLDR